MARRRSRPAVHAGPARDGPGPRWQRRHRPGEDGTVLAVRPRPPPADSFTGSRGNGNPAAEGPRPGTPARPHLILENDDVTPPPGPHSGAVSPTRRASTSPTVRSWLVDSGSGR